MLTYDEVKKLGYLDPDDWDKGIYIDTTHIDTNTLNPGTLRGDWASVFVSMRVVSIEQPLWEPSHAGFHTGICNKGPLGFATDALCPENSLYEWQDYMQIKNCFIYTPTA